MTGGTAFRPGVNSEASDGSSQGQAKVKATSPPDPWICLFLLIPRLERAGHERIN